jgi:hypothetical protein
MTEYEEQPPTEHTTHDPWPDGFDVPDVLAKLKAKAEANGWEARTGYARGYEKRGRGKVGGEGDARWVRCHYVALQVRRGPGDRLFNRVIYGAPTEADALEWAVASVQVAGLPSNITGFRRLIKEAVT